VVLAQNALERELRLLPKRLPEVVVEVREETHVRRDRIDGRLQPRVPVRIEVRLVRLTRGLDQRRRVLEKRDADGVRAASRRHAHLQLIDRIV